MTEEKTLKPVVAVDGMCVYMCPHCGRNEAVQTSPKCERIECLSTYYPHHVDIFYLICTTIATYVHN